MSQRQSNCCAFSSLLQKKVPCFHTVLFFCDSINYCLFKPQLFGQLVDLVLEEGAPPSDGICRPVRGETLNASTAGPSIRHRA